MTPDQVIKTTKEKMDKGVDHFRVEMSKMRTGRASLSLIDGVKVNYYGTPTPLAQVATMGTPEPRLITIQPWDASVIGEIEKALLASGLGLTPSNDGKTIRLPIPPLTEERRKELVKVSKKMAEDAKIVLRNIRRDENDALKKLEKDKQVSEDDAKRLQKKIQEITDDSIRKIDELLGKKEKEILEV